MTFDRYRKRPITVDAAQWDGSVIGASVIIDEVLAMGGKAMLGDGDMSTPRYIAVETPDAIGRVFANDWLIRGAAGDFYPCKAEIFEATYEEYEP